MWVIMLTSHCRAAMAREGEKDRHQNRYPEKWGCKSSPGLGMEAAEGYSQKSGPGPGQRTTEHKGILGRRRPMWL